MTHIKCRYWEPMCTYNCWPPKKIEWDDWWFCDGPCQYDGEYQKPEGAKGHYLPDGSYVMPVINPTCKHSWIEHYEFERDYKRYEFSGMAGLILGPKQIDMDQIDYLEIDGRVLVKEQDNGQSRAPEGGKT